MGGKIKSKTCPDNPNISLCGELFYGLEKYLAGNPGTYKYWEKVAENLEVDRLAYTTAQEIISALRETKQKYGIEVAQTLYNTHSGLFLLPHYLKAKIQSCGFLSFLLLWNYLL